MSHARRRAAAAVAITALLAGCTSGPDASPSPSAEPVPTTGVYSPALGDVDAAFAQLARTANYSALDQSPSEGSWTYPMTEAGFQAIADAGFTAVRLPIRFSIHNDPSAPYTITPQFFERVDWAIDQALSRGLAIIIDEHHWGIDGGPDGEALFTDPSANRAELESIWRQIAERYADQPVGVIFEIKNEPHDALDGVWNEYQAALLAIIRESNPDRAVIVTPGAYSSVGALDDLVLPDDPHLILTVHDYDPHPFTHQGATWIDPIPPVGTRWSPDDAGLAPNWDDWSWAPVHQFTGAGFHVAAEKDWDGGYFHSYEPVVAPATIAVTFAEDEHVWIDCTSGNGPAGEFHARAGQPLTFSTSECGLSGPPLTDIKVMVGANPGAEYTITQLTVDTGSGPASIFGTALGTMTGLLDQVAAWSAAHGDIPVFVGEFGSTDLADQASREAWFTAMVREMEARGFAWGFWEFQSTWGVWNPDDGEFAPWLVDILTGA